ncbi:hypothetical protein [Tenacibaculum agarivorans]|uniref:hypothetical protein n=1 Tax=Tenacibaculum agarivorans TaxID=1908389 RepID=UPI001180C288|nr:hypothetical protein [Tenacibaculum agarivorans]
MITTKDTTVTNYNYNTNTSIISFINDKIKKAEKNSIGITVLIVMISTMIASVSAGLAIHNQISYFIVAFTLVTAMGTNAAAFSQSGFKYVAWAGLLSIVGNTLLIIYQMFLLLIF